MKWIHLGHEYFACVDLADYENVSKYIWRHHPRGYARTHQVHFGGKDIFLHEFLLPEKASGQEIDHKNRAPWDNRRLNLRIVEVWQNQQNKGIPLSAPYPSDDEMKEAIEQRRQLKNSQSFRSESSKKAQGWKTRERNRVRRKVQDSQGNIFSSPQEAAKYYEAPNGSNILECCKGNKKTAYGQEWSFCN